MTPRLQPVAIDEVNEAIRRLFDDYETHYGYISPVAKILGRREEYVRLYDLAKRTQEAPDSTLSPRDKILIQAKVAAGGHNPYAMKRLRELNSFSDLFPAALFEAIFRQTEVNDGFSTREHLVLQLGDALTGTLINDALWDALHAEFSETELLDLLVIGSIEAFFATFVRAVGLTSLDMPDLKSPTEDLAG